MSNLQIKERPEENGKNTTHPKQSQVLALEPAAATLLFPEDRAAWSLLNKLIRNSLVTHTSEVEVLQKDPDSPLHSVKTFEELCL